MTYRTIKLTATSTLVAKLWVKAETRLQAKVLDSMPDCDEPVITKVFHSELAQVLKEANDRRQVEKAFLQDLKSSICGAGSATDKKLQQYAQGIIASVGEHDLSTERTTGGDLGVVIAQPEIGCSANKLYLNRVRQGLLVQAKIKKRNGKWGLLTKKQRSVLAPNFHFVSLLLYQYSDDCRRELDPFQWQLCRDSKLADVVSWLKRGDFPSPCDSYSLIKSLGLRKIGTSDTQKLNQFVEPAGILVLRIIIDWPDGKRPEAIVTLRKSHQKVGHVKHSND